MLISSSTNPVVRRARRLARRSERLKYGLYLAEGPRVVEAALERGAAIDSVLYAPDMLNADELELAERAARAGRHSFSLSSVAMRAASDTVTPQGLLALIGLPKTSAEALHAASAGSQCPLLYLDGWQDPGNTGAAIRTAAAAGLRAVACSPGAADPFGPKAVRAGAGAHFAIEVGESVSWESVQALAPGEVWCAAPRDGEDWSGLPWEECRVLVVGGETSGLQTAIESAVTRWVSIPMSGAVESLNAAAAAGLLSYAAAGLGSRTRTPA